MCDWFKVFIMPHKLICYPLIQSKGCYAHPSDGVRIAKRCCPTAHISHVSHPYRHLDEDTMFVRLKDSKFWRPFPRENYALQAVITEGFVLSMKHVIYIIPPLEKSLFIWPNYTFPFINGGIFLTPQYPHPLTMHLCRKTESKGYYFLLGSKYPFIALSFRMFFQK